MALWFAACDVGAEPRLAPWTFQFADPDDAIPQSGPIRIQVDRRLSPWSVDRSTVRLSSGAVGEFIFPSFDPLQNELVIELTRPLLPDVSYVVTLTGLIDLDGAQLGAERKLLMSVTDVEAPPPPPADAFSAVEALFATHCTTPACHNAADRAGGLELGEVSGIVSTALGKPSPQVASVNVLVESVGAGLIDLPIIEDSGTPQSVARSYLIYKVLGDPHVLGEAMPPPTHASAMSPDDVELLARWIRAGASLE